MERTPEEIEELHARRAALFAGIDETLAERKDPDDPAVYAEIISLAAKMKERAEAAPEPPVPEKTRTFTASEWKWLMEQLGDSTNNAITKLRTEIQDWTHKKLHKQYKAIQAMLDAMLRVDEEVGVLCNDFATKRKAIETDIAELKSANAILQTRVDVLEAKVSELVAAISGLSDQVSDVERVAKGTAAQVEHNGKVDNLLTFRQAL